MTFLVFLVCEKHDYIYYKDMCFKPGNSKKTWTDAKKDCERSGGKLISIDTETKLSTTIDFLMNICEYTIFHLCTKYFFIVYIMDFSFMIN